MQKTIAGPDASVDETPLWAALKKTCKKLAEGGIVMARIKGPGKNKAKKNGKAGETG